MDDFEEMMAWALGPEWRMTNVKHAGDIWKMKHPERMPLEPYYGSPLMIAANYIYQISLRWQYKKAQQSSKIDISLWSKIKTFFKELFK